MPLWGRLSLGALGAALVAWFFLGGMLRGMLRGASHRDTPTARIVDIEFGDSDAGEVDGYRAYYRYELVPVRIRLRDSQGRAIAGVKPSAQVFRDDLLVKDAGKRMEIPLRYDDRTAEWRGNWTAPVGTSTGVYRVECAAMVPAGCLPPGYVDVPRVQAAKQEQPRDRRLRRPERPLDEADSSGAESLPKDQPVRISEEREFRMAAREPTLPAQGFGVVSWEIISPDLQRDLHVRLPSGEVGDWRGVFQWLDLFAPDMFWYSGYITSAEFEPLPEGVPWFQPNVRAIDAIGQEAHQRGLKFGVYCFAYRMNGAIELLPDYDTAYYNPNVRAGLAVPSLLNDRRIDDLAAMARSLDENPNVDMIGFDYIRDAEPTYDGVDRFVADVNPPLPSDWSSRSLEERMEWLKGECAKVSRAVRTDADLRVWRLWCWWRAHRVSEIIRDVRARSGATKPFWAFTLSSLHGVEHGQDPFMFQDAGIDLDAPMLYQMDSTAQFEAFLTTNPESWHNYTAKGPLNLCPGNQVDHYWNQRNIRNVTTDPPSPIEFHRRLLVALETCRYKEPGKPDRGPVGVFCHDVMRTAGVRNEDPYTGADWALSGASAMTAVRSQWGSIPLQVGLAAPDNVTVGQTVEGIVSIANTTDRTISGVCAAAFPLEGMQVVDRTPAGPIEIRPGQRAELRVRWRVTSRAEARSGWLMSAVRVTWTTPGYFPSATAFDYVRVR